MRNNGLIPIPHVRVMEMGVVMVMNLIIQRRND